MAIDISAKAQKLLSKLASSKAIGYVKLKRETGGSIDPDTGLYTAGTETLIPVDAAVTQFSAIEIDGTRIMHGDKRIVFAPDIEPMATDKVMIGDDEFTIIGEIDDVNHAGTTQVYKAQVRSI